MLNVRFSGQKRVDLGIISQSPWKAPASRPVAEPAPRFGSESTGNYASRFVSTARGWA